MARSYADVFLEEILRNPDDDTPRLVYADWLDEQGDAARAEFIRVQCALAAKHLPAERRAKLERRAQALRMQYDTEWSRPVRRLVRMWEFHRGFIDEVMVGAGKFLTCARRLFQRAPVQHLRLMRDFPSYRGRPFSMPVLVENRYLRRLRTLDLADNRLENQDVRALLVSGHLGSLRSLSLAGNHIGDGGARALAESPLLAALTSLDLCFNQIGPAGARALAESLGRLARSTDGLRLRRLDLSRNRLGAAGRRLFARSALLRRLVQV